MKPILHNLFMGFLGVGLVCSALACHSVSHSNLPLVLLRVGGQSINAEVANQEITRETGLMFRKEMEWGSGMIFVFPDSAPRYFWMKNTYIPLSIAFLDEKGVVLNVLEMPPLTESSFRSEGPAKYALEMNKGWFAKYGVRTGAVIEGLAAVPTPVN